MTDFWRQIDPREAVELTRSLVRIPSITSREGLAISEAVRDWYAQRGVEVELIPAGTDRASVVAEVGAGEPVLVLNAHLDTKWTEGMTIDPFAAELRDGKIYGRGACDTKGSVAGMMVAFTAAVKAGFPRVGTLRTVFEVGEEGDDWAALSLFEKGYLRATWAVVGEPSGGRIEIGNRGRLAGAVRTYGRSTHTATAELGVNAIEKMARLISALQALPYRRTSDPIWGRPPLNVWKIRSEGWEATVPYECTAWFDARLNPNAGPEVVLGQIEELLEKLAAEDIDFHAELLRNQVKLSLPAAYVKPDHELVQA
ncbi:MAG TPA: M20 family peptidase, partial [Bacteroidetes bacterium]|nr:M20 family peptidase [Bacteroidota bacterium]